MSCHDSLTRVRTRNIQMSVTCLYNMDRSRASSKMSLPIVVYDPILRPGFMSAWVESVMIARSPESHGRIDLRCSVFVPAPGQSNGDRHAPCTRYCILSVHYSTVSELTAYVKH